MPQSALEMAKELSLALIETGNVPAEDMQDTLQRTHVTLLTLKAQEEFGTTTALPVVETAVNWRKSITKHAVTCLECGKTFRQLSRRHLQEHGLDGRSYRATYGIPRTQSLAAKETTARRKQIARERRLWEKTPTFRKAQERDGNIAPKPEAAAPKRKRTPPARQRNPARKQRSAG